MVRKFLLIGLAAVTSAGYAQNWCPPGATWTYSTSSWFVTGVTLIQYAGDTLVGDTLAQVLNMQTIGYDHQAEHDTVITYSPALTTVSGDLVQIWNESRFDTLYWFGAAPGDHWNMSVSPYTDYPQFVKEVLDTGHVVIDGIQTHYLLTTGLFTISDTIFERIGTCSEFMIPAVAIYEDAFGGPLRCYGDAQIQYHVGSWSDCDITTGIKPNATSVEFQINPNPGTDHFALSLPPGPHAISLFDPTGRMVHQQRISDERATINTAHLPSGIYLVRVDEGLKPLRWVKE